jgi:O-antigen ligase
MDEQILGTIRILFWALAALVFFLPVRWAVLAYLLIAHFDLSGSALASTSEIGFENTIRVLVLPLWLLLRMRLRPIRASGWSWASAAWVLLVFWAATTTLWSPFQLSALKMVSYLLSYLLLYPILSYAYAQSYLGYRNLISVLWLSLGLAALQTWVIPFQFLTTEGRFTSFVSPQSFAAYLVAVLSILLFSKKSGFFHAFTVLTVIFGIFLTGSRYVLFGLLLLLGIAWVMRMVRGGNARSAVLVFFKGTAGIAAIALLFGVFVEVFPDSRVHQLLTSNPYGQSVFQNVGTLVWRLGVYQETIREIGENDLPRLIFGSGTSSGAEFMLRYDRRYRGATIDANRVLHNEFLRALYEWGIVGLTLLVGFLVLIFAKACVRVWRDGSVNALAVICACPVIVFSLSIENVLAAAGGPGGVGFVLVLAFGLAGRTEKRQVAAPAPGAFVVSPVARGPLLEGRVTT